MKCNRGVIALPLSLVFACGTSAAPQNAGSTDGGQNANDAVGSTDGAGSGDASGPARDSAASDVAAGDGDGDASIEAATGDGGGDASIETATGDGGSGSSCHTNADCGPALVCGQSFTVLDMSHIPMIDGHRLAAGRSLGYSGTTTSYDTLYGVSCNAAVDCVPSCVAGGTAASRAAGSECVTDRAVCPRLLAGPEHGDLRARHDRLRCPSHPGA